MRARFPIDMTTIADEVISDSSMNAMLIAMDGPRLTGQGVLTFDRTEFGSHYGSSKLFRFLGKHIVNDHIHLHVKIHAEREG